MDNPEWLTDHFKKAIEFLIGSRYIDFTGVPALKKIIVSLQSPGIFFEEEKKANNI